MFWIEKKKPQFEELFPFSAHTAWLDCTSLQGMPADLTRKPHLGKAQCMLGILSQEGLLCDVSVQSGPKALLSQTPLSLSVPTTLVAEPHRTMLAKEHGSVLLDLFSWQRFLWPPHCQTKCVSRDILRQLIFESNIQDQNSTCLCPKGLSYFFLHKCVLSASRVPGTVVSPGDTANEVGFLPRANLCAGTTILRLQQVQVTPHLQKL